MSKADLPSAPTGTNLKRVQYDDRRKPSAGNLVTRFIATKNLAKRHRKKAHTRWKQYVSRYLSHKRLPRHQNGHPCRDVVDIRSPWSMESVMSADIIVVLRTDEITILSTLCRRYPPSTGDRSHSPWSLQRRVPRENPSAPRSCVVHRTLWTAVFYVCIICPQWLDIWMRLLVL